MSYRITNAYNMECNIFSRPFKLDFTNEFHFEYMNTYLLVFIVVGFYFNNARSSIDYGIYSATYFLFPYWSQILNRKPLSPFSWIEFALIMLKIVLDSEKEKWWLWFIKMHMILDCTQKNRLKSFLGSWPLRLFYWV